VFAGTSTSFGSGAGAGAAGCAAPGGGTGGTKLTIDGTSRPPGGGATAGAVAALRFGPPAASFEPLPAVDVALELSGPLRVEAPLRGLVAAVFAAASFLSFAESFIALLGDSRVAALAVCSPRLG
jgi:hypothetical protein